MIKYPLRVQKDEGSPFAHIRDASNKVFAGGLIPIDAHAFVEVFNKAVEVFQAFADEGNRDHQAALSALILAVSETLPRTERAAPTVRGPIPIAKRPRRKNKREQMADELRESDVTARTAGRDNIVYGHHDDLPQCGEHVARLVAK